MEFFKALTGDQELVWETLCTEIVLANVTPSSALRSAKLLLLLLLLLARKAEEEFQLFSSFAIKKSPSLSEAPPPQVADPW